MTDFKKKPGDARSVTDKLGADMTRALMTAPGKSLPAAVASYERKSGRTIHNPLADQCYCQDCTAARMAALYPQAMVPAG